MTMKPVKVVHLDDVKPITWGGEEAARFLLRGEDTGGLYSFYEVSVPSGEGSLFHIHEDTNEAFYVIEGEFEITIDRDAHKVPAGALVYGPCGVGHSFVNTWHKPSKMLCTTTPGGIEKFFEELSQDPFARTTALPHLFGVEWPSSLASIIFTRRTTMPCSSCPT